MRPRPLPRSVSSVRTLRSPSLWLSHSRKSQMLSVIESPTSSTVLLRRCVVSSASTLGVPRTSGEVSGSDGQSLSSRRVLHRPRERCVWMTQAGSRQHITSGITSAAGGE